jgi:hypothetical protein
MSYKCGKRSKCRPRPDWLDPHQWQAFLRRDERKFDQGAVGKKPSCLILCHPIKKRINRQELRNICKSGNIRSMTWKQFTSICAWGGIINGNYHSAMQQWANWSQFRRTLRRSNSLEDIYNSFINERNIESIKGIRAAYDTKIITFMRPDLNPYIMDQWTSKAINVLSRKNRRINFKYIGKYLSDNNTAGDYVLFCERMKQLTCLYHRQKCLRKHQSEAERADCFESRLFGRGGSNRSRWRQYVIRNSQT